MSTKLNKSVVTEPHKKIKNKKVTITTISKSNRTKLTSTEIKMIAEGILRRAKPRAKLMVKVLSNKGYFQMKSYDDSMDVILNEDDYINSREGIEAPTIFKASFYII